MQRCLSVNTMQAMARFQDRLSPLAFDGIAAVVLFGIGLFSLTEADPSVNAFTRSPDAFNYLVLGAMTLPVALRRRYPAAVLATVSIAFVIDRSLGYPVSLGIWSIPLALHAVGTELAPARSIRIAGTAIVGLVGFTVLGALTTQDVAGSTVITMLVFTVLPYVLGREVHQGRQVTASLEQRTAELERRQQEEARRAVRRERQRIARELHDVVAHDMTVMTIQTAAARRLMGSDLERAAAALEAVEAAGHEALDEMRRLLNVLRPQHAEPVHTPQPGLDRLGDLTVQMQEAGLDVNVAIEGDPMPLPAGIDLNVYRIIQESLTNALKHGGPSTKATVRLAYGDTALHVEVVDDGRGAARALSAAQNGTGRGLVGMRERVTLLHGEMTAGPRPGGGYRVRSTIPLTAS